MTEFMEIGEPMPTDTLADLLEQIAVDVRRGDSFEGFIEYLLPDPEEAPPECRMVRARLRTGNLRGQGGMVTFGSLVERPGPS